MGTLQVAVRSALQIGGVDRGGRNLRYNLTGFSRESLERRQGRLPRAMNPAKHYYFIPQIVAVLIVGPLVWMAMDRTPPLILSNGIIAPHEVHRQQTVSVIWHAKFSGQHCPGVTQRELIERKSHNIWPKEARQRKGIFIPEKNNPYLGTVVTPPLTIPDMSAGKACYRVTQFYFCNWLQRVMNWPIVQVSPCIDFEVVP